MPQIIAFLWNLLGRSSSSSDMQNFLGQSTVDSSTVRGRGRRGSIGDSPADHHDSTGSSIGDLSSGVNGLFESIFGTDFGNLIQSLTAYFAKTGLTGEQKEMNAYTAGREDTYYQRMVKDMQSAGLNPAMMYGGSASGAGVNASASSNGGLSMSELIQLATLPKQLKMLDAQIDNTKSDTSLKDANAANTIQRTLTEEQETKIRKIAADFGYELTSANLQIMLSTVDKIAADTGLSLSQQDLVNNQSEAQSIVNQYLDKRQQAELNQLAANAKHLDASAKLADAQSWMARIQAQFADDNGFLMSSNDMLNVATYIGSLLGVAKDDVAHIVQLPKKWVYRLYNKSLSSSGGGER